MSLQEYLIIGVGMMVLLLVYYIFSRDSQQNRQMHAIASAVETLNHQLFKLEQRMHEGLRTMESHEKDCMNEADLRYELEVGISEHTKPLKTRIHELEAELREQKEELRKRIMHVEENFRVLSLPASVNGMDDERIISLFKKGVDIETITKELRLSKPEVEFVLKINQLK